MIAFSSFPSFFHVHAASPSIRYLPPSSSTWLGSRTSSAANSTFLSTRVVLISVTKRIRSPRPTVPTVPCAVLGGGGFLGVGPGEVVVILAVGWFLLGPTKMYELAKESGRILGSLRKTADEARESFREALELEFEKERTLEQLEESNEQQSVATRTTTEHKTVATTDANEQTLPVVPMSDATTKTTMTTVKNNPQAVDNSQSEIDFNSTVSPVPSLEDQLSELPPPDKNFLDQLRRAADPNQIPPQSVPDLDVSVEFEEEEVKRLEREYLEARARLEARKNSSGTTSTVNRTGEEIPTKESTADQSGSELRS